MCMKTSNRAANQQMQMQQQEAAEARAREEQRALRIRQGQARIDQMFNGGREIVGWQQRDPTVQRPKMPGSVGEIMYRMAGGGSGTKVIPGGDGDEPIYGDKVIEGFDDKFFQKRRDAYMGYYQPQMDTKFKEAREALEYALARAGTSNSSIAGEKMAELQRQYAENQAAISSKADADVNGFRSRIANEKSALVSQLNATGDADRAGNEATQRTQMLMKDVPEYNPLGDIFSGVANTVGGFARAAQDREIAGSNLETRSPRRTPTRTVT